MYPAKRIRRSLKAVCAISQIDPLPTIIKKQTAASEYASEAAVAFIIWLRFLSNTITAMSGQCGFDPQQTIVFCCTIATAWRTGLDLPCVQTHCQIWKKYTPILASSISADGQTFNFPALLKNTMTIIHTRKSFGCAYGVKNPFDKEVICYVEGRLWHTPEAKIYIYIQHKDGKVTKLVEDNNPDAVEEVSNKFPDGKVHVRHYMKLQIEAPMKPGDRLVIAGVRPDNQGKYVGKTGLGTFRIDGWGKPWNPIISFEVP